MLDLLKRPVVFDGLIYALIAACAAMTASMSSDDAAKFIAPLVLFWIKTTAAVTGSTLLAVKMYRSTTFAEYKQAQNGSYQKQNGGAPEPHPAPAPPPPPSPEQPQPKP